MLTLKELKDWVNSLPDEFIDYAVVQGEEGQIDEDYYYRVDSPIVSLNVDTETKEILILTVAREELKLEDLNNE